MGLLGDRAELLCPGTSSLYYCPDSLISVDTTWEGNQGMNGPHQMTSGWLWDGKGTLREGAEGRTRQRCPPVWVTVEAAVLVAVSPRGSQQRVGDTFKYHSSYSWPSPISAMHERDWCILKEKYHLWTHQTLPQWGSKSTDRRICQSRSMWLKQGCSTLGELWVSGHPQARVFPEMCTLSWPRTIPVILGLQQRMPQCTL